MCILSLRWSWWVLAKKCSLCLLAIAMAGSAGSRAAWAYPELVRHGYSNCTSCHLSPDGGGILSQYGRQLSREVLSTAGREGEEGFTFGELPSWLGLQGDLRTLNIRQDFGTAQTDRLILMQADLEGVVSHKEWNLVGTIGRLDTAIYPQGSNWISRRHYLLWRPLDEWAVRAGRFQTQYGINMADHFTTVKRGLSFDTAMETYNVEGAWLSEKYNLSATLNLGRFDDRSLQRETGATATASTMLGERIKAGLSYLYGTNDLARRHLLGPWAIVGISTRAFLLSELDFQRNFPFDAIDPKYGFAAYERLDFEPLQGLHFFGTFEASKLDFAAERSRLLRYGAGIQFFPRPHFEVEAAWQIQQDLRGSEDFRKVLWLMFHYYV